jgi:hypothetical protein
MNEAHRKRLLDKTFRYVKSSETDVARTFARIRKQIKEAEAAKAAPKVAAVAPTPIKRRA